MFPMIFFLSARLSSSDPKIQSNCNVMVSVSFAFLGCPVLISYRDYLCICVSEVCICTYAYICVCA